MLIHRKVVECDFKNIKYTTPVDGVACLAQGATGRWCEVMHGGPEFKADQIENNTPILTHEEAVKAVTEMGGHNTVDF